MARRSRGGCLGLIGIVVLLLLLIAFLEKGHFHLPSFGTHSNGGLHATVVHLNNDRAMISRWISEAPS